MADDMAPVYAALKQADAAGDKASAQQLATYIKSKGAKGGPGLRMEVTDAGRRLGGAVKFEKDYPALPYLDRAQLALRDNPQEKEAFLEGKYGKGSVGTDKRGLYVTVGGKRMRASTGALAEAGASVPEAAGATIGAVAGSAAGPAGSIVGAGLGGAAGKAGVEIYKELKGDQRKTAGETATAIAGAGVGSAVGEGAFRVAKAPISRLTRGPLPNWVTGTATDTAEMTGKERTQMIEKMTKKGAMIHPQSSMPEAIALQRKVIMADKLLRRRALADKTNTGILRDTVSDILDKAKVTGKAKDETMARLTGADSAMSFQDAGKELQQGLRHIQHNFKPNTKVGAYIGQLIPAGKTPEDAYHLITEPGQVDRTERIFNALGMNSRAVGAIQNRALRELLSGALKRNEAGEITGVIEAELAKFPPKQQRLLFGDMVGDLKLLSKEAKFLFPEIKDPAMAGFAAGQVLGRSPIKFPKVWQSRLLIQGYNGMWRMFLQNPSAARRLAIGFRGDSAQRMAARGALREVFYFGALEASAPPETQNESPRPR